jgi:hypothetical protein
MYCILKPNIESMLTDFHISKYMSVAEAVVDGKWANGNL